MSDKEMVRQIDRYIKGNLSEQEIDQLWTEFLREPKYLKWLEIEVAARDYFLKKENGGNGLDTTEMNAVWFPGTRSVKRHWIYRLAVVFMVIVFFQWLNTGVFDQSGPATEILPREMSAMDVYRALETEYDPFDIEINRGFEAAMSGRTEESKEIYGNLLREELTTEQFTIASLNKGILLYNEARYEEASEAFSAVIRSGEPGDYMMEKSWWFLSQAQTWLEEYESAAAAAIRVREHDGIFRDDAVQLIQFLEKKTDK